MSANYMVARRGRRRVAVAASVAAFTFTLAVTGEAQAVEASGELHAFPASGECPAARVAGFSYLLDAFETGSAAGPGVIYGIALAVLGNPLPEPLGSYQGEFLGESGSVVEQFSKDAPQSIRDSRSLLEPLSEFNDQSNALIEAGAQGAETIANEAGPFIQPGDSSLRQLAAALRDAEAPEESC